MYGGFTFAGGVFAGTNILIPVRRRLGVGIGGSGFPRDWFAEMLDAEKRRLRREQIIAMREDEDSIMNV